MTEHKSAEDRAREIVAIVRAKHGRYLGLDDAAYLITAAITAAEREAYERCAEVAEAISAGYAGSHCEHCRDGEIAAGNTAYHIRALAKEGESCT